MKRFYAVFLIGMILFTIMPGYHVFSDAADFQPIAVAGFNADLIAENADGASADTSTSHSFDAPNSGGNNVMYSVGFRGPKNPGAPPPFGLPADGRIDSSQNPGVAYQLAPYGGNNALLLVAQNETRTLTLQTSGAYEKIILLASSAEGQSTFDVTLLYSDGTSSDVAFIVPDWYGGAGYATQGIGRVTRNAQFLPPNNWPFDQDGAFSGDAGNPRLYDCILDNAAHRTQILTAIQVKKTSAGGRTAILAAAGQKNAGAPAAPVVGALAQLQATSFEANWSSVAGATAYVLDVATDAAFSSPVPGYNNRNVGNVLTWTVAGLTAGTTYHVRVRAMNADGAGFSSNVVSAATTPLSGDATLGAATTIKGVAVTDFGTPSASLAAVVSGTITLTAVQGADGTNAGGYVTAFVANDAAAAVTRVVKYAAGADFANFATDAPYDATLPIADGDTLVTQVQAENGALLFYRVTATVQAPLSSDADLSGMLGQSITTGPEAGTALDPKTATLHVSSGTATVSAADVTAHDAGAAVTFFGTDHTFTVPEAGHAGLVSGGQTGIHVRIVAEDGTTRYYRILVVRAAPPSGGGTATPTPEPSPAPSPEMSPDPSSTPSSSPSPAPSSAPAALDPESAATPVESSVSVTATKPEPGQEDPGSSASGTEADRAVNPKPTATPTPLREPRDPQAGTPTPDPRGLEEGASSPPAEEAPASGSESALPDADADRTANPVEDAGVDASGSADRSEASTDTPGGAVAGGGSAASLVDLAADILRHPFSRQQPPGPVLDLTLRLDLGARIADRLVTVTANGLKPFSDVTLTVHSTPRVLGHAQADAHGVVSIQAVFPKDLPDGPHSVVAEGIGPGGEPVQAVSAFELDREGNVTAFSPPAQVLQPMQAGDSRLARAMEAGKPLYDAQRHPGTVVTLIVVFAGLGGMASVGGMKKPVLGGGRGRTSGPARPVGAAAHASGSARQAESPGPAAGSANQGESSGEEGELIEAVVIDVEGDEAEHGEKHLRWGDRSLLWRLPGTAGTDRWSTWLVDRLSGVSLLLARLASDGSWARAMFGSGGFALWGIGLILGLLSAVQVGFMALPPAFPLVSAMVVLGILDGAAGATAWLTIALLALVSGHVASWEDVRSLAGMAALFTSLLYLVGMRPVRRKIEDRKKHTFDRLLDYVMPAVVLFVASPAMLEAINGLSGLEVFAEEATRNIGWIAVGALWVRLALEDLSTVLFPVRCEAVRPESAREQARLFQWGAILAYEAMFLLISGPFFGFGLALVCIMALDTVPWMLSFAEDRFPNSPFLHKWYPGATSIYVLTLLMVVNLVLSARLIQEGADYRQISRAFVLLLIPYTLAEIPGLFGREGEALPDNWWRRIAETGVWILFSLVVLEIVPLG